MLLLTYDPKPQYSLTSPYGSPQRMAKIHEQIAAALVAPFVLMAEDAQVKKQFGQHLKNLGVIDEIVTLFDPKEPS